MLTNVTRVTGKLDRWTKEVRGIEERMALKDGTTVRKVIENILEMRNLASWLSQMKRGRRRWGQENM